MLTKYATLYIIVNINGSVPERPKGPDCKSGVTDFVGSNPTRPILIYNFINSNVTFRPLDLSSTFIIPTYF